MCEGAIEAKLVLPSGECAFNCPQKEEEEEEEGRPSVSEGVLVGVSRQWW